MSRLAGEPDEPHVEVERTALPGIGVRYELLTTEGRRIAVISYRNGRREFAVYDTEDPDACCEVLALTDEESDALAELLGAPHIVERLADMQRDLGGLETAELVVEAGSPFDGRSLGDTKARTRTGASIVAIVRGGRVIASPRPDFVFEPSDLVIVVGTSAAVLAVAHILETPPG